MNTRYVNVYQVIFLCLCLITILSFDADAQSYNISNSTVSTCSGSFYDSGGPGGSYSSSESFTMTFNPDMVGMRLRFDFTFFSVENNFDFLTIYDGPSTGSPLIGVFTGTNGPGVVTSTDPTGALTFDFSSDISVTGSGWDATISCVAPPPEFLMANSVDSTCEGKFLDDGGSAGNYSDGQSLTQTFYPDAPFNALNINFTSFDLEACCDSLFVYDGPNTSSPLIGGYSGLVGPGSVTSSDLTGALTFEFSSDASINNTGWEADISCVSTIPDILISNATDSTCLAKFYDAGGPVGNYNTNEFFVHTLFPDQPNNLIQVDFTFFDTESCCDFLDIYDGPSTSDPLIGSFSGTAGPGLVTSSHPTGALTFLFDSDFSINDFGWEADVSCVFDSCSADVDPPTAVCQNVEIEIVSLGLVSVDPIDIDFGSNDFCGIASVSLIESDLILSGVIDGPLTGGTPKAVELFAVNDIPDLSIYGLGVANNGGGSDGLEYTFPPLALSAGDYLHITTDSAQFHAFFGFAPDIDDNIVNMNGDDPFELYKNGNVVDVFGDVALDGTGEPWEYLDGWAYRNAETGPDGATFNLGSWSFSGPNALDGEATNAGATNPIPIQTFTRTDALTLTCDNLGSNNVTLIVTDNNGNESTCASIVTLVDSLPPMVTAPASNIIGCGESSHPDSSGVGNTILGTATVVDVCDTMTTLTYSDSIAPESCPFISRIFRTWTAVDASGNQGSAVQIILIDDFEAPTTILPPDPLPIEWPVGFNLAPVGPNTPQDASIDTSIYGVATATDNCSEPMVSFQDSLVGPSPGNCPNLWFVERHWTAVDSCGNSAAAGVQTFTFTDTTAPTIACPADPLPIEWPVGFNLSPVGPNTPQDPSINPGIFGMATGTDNCGTPTITYQDSLFGPTPGSCPNLWVVNRFWTSTDNCGLTAECIQTFVFSDTTAPTIACPADPLPIEWPVGFSLMPVGPNTPQDASIDPGTFGMATGTDNCGNPTITYQDSLFGPTPGSCPNLWVVNRYWTSTDNCGLTAECVQTFTFTDTTAPVLSCVASLTFETDSGQTFATVTIPMPTATDNCGIPSITNNIAGTGDPSGIYPTGTTDIVWVATDACGNTDTCITTVTVTDQQNPQITCPNDVSVGTDPDSCSAMVNGLIATTIDNGGIMSITNNSPFAVSGGADASGQYPVGATVVQFIATDSLGNTDTCSMTVTVSDDELPTASCLLNIAVGLDGNGQVFIGTGLIDNNSSDNCGIASLSLSKQMYTCADLGFNSVTLTATDLSGNVNACVTNIQIQDNIKPNVTCQNATVSLDSNGVATLAGSDFLSSATDNCAVTSITTSPATLTCADIGANAIVVTAFDQSGNNRSCNATANVIDDMAPMASCKDATVNLDSMGNAQITTMDINDGSTDNCAIASMSLDTDSFNCADVGANTVTLTVTDASGNVDSCTATVTVADGISPTAICQDRDVQLDANGNGTMMGMGINNGSFDNCAIATLSLDSTSFDCSEIGANPVVLTVTDVNGNSSTCTAVVNVSDTVPPIAVCNDLTVSLDSTGNGSITAMMVNNGSSDACGIDTITIDIASFNCSDVGTESVTLMVTDVNGNSSTCTSVITIQDNIAPVALCNDLMVQLDSSGNGSITTMMVNNGSTDACGIDTMTLDKSMFTCADVGSDTVTLTVTDVNGNPGSCEAVITVQDNVAPEAVCQPFAVQLNTFGSGTLNGSDIDGGSSDACGIVSLSADLSTFSCADVGSSFTALLTVTDNNGNTDTCSAAVTVEDNVKPAANCRDITVELDANGNVMIAPIDVDNFSFDACGIASRVIDIDSFSCAEVGPNAVALTVTDVNGNDSTCTSIVTVVDLLPPVVTCQDVSVTLDSSGNGSLMVGEVFISATDVCGVDSSYLSQSDFSCADIGIAMITLNVTDVNGNIGECDVDVTVTDTTAPVAICNDMAIVLNASGMATIVSDSLDGGSTDACGIESIIAEQTSFGCSDVGTNSIQLLVIDSSGNIGNCTSLVTVSDTTDPTALCKNATVNVGANGQAPITPATVNNGSNDACGIASLSVSPTSVGCTGSGTIATLTVTDNNGNVDSCTSVITVQDRRNPTAVCIQGISVGLDSTGSVTVAANVVGANSFDNCGIASLTLTPNTFDCDDIGQNSVQLKATDAAGNNGFCNTNIDVQDIFGACLVNCPQPQNTSTSMISYTTARINWDTVGNATGYVVEGRPVGAGFTVSLSIPSGATSFKDVGALQPGTSYEWQIKTICSNSESAFTALETFTTLTCNTPLSPSENILSSSQVDLMWTPVAGAIGYRITGGVPSSPNAATLDVTGQASSSFLVTGLQPGQTYVWRIQAICSANPLVASANTVTRMFTMPLFGASQAKDTENGMIQMPTSMQLYPNPNEGRFQVEVKDLDQRGELVIYDVLGRVITQQNIPAASDQRINIDMTRQEKGTYLIRLVIGETQIIKRVIVQ